MKGPSRVGPEVRIINRAGVDRLKRGDLVAEETAEMASMAQPVIGQRPRLGPQPERSDFLEIVELVNNSLIGIFILMTDQDVASAVIGLRIEKLAGDLLVIGHRIGLDGLAHDEVAAPFLQSAQRGFVLHVEPVDRQADLQCLGQSPRQLDIEPGSATVLFSLTCA